ncbi:MAG: preprotein translocase subunit SecY, partial [Coxiellaceae bacterium]|nr:preprotein translocase subunit SecY [Coxiellaceae bacterium]
MAKPKLGTGLSSGGLSELRNRLLFVLIGIVVYRLGAYIPVPGLDPARVAALFAQHGGGILGVFNVFSGGALSRMTLFALGVMPYISASIIIQMYATVSPKLTQLKKEGQQGQRKINQYTRYATVFLSLLQALGISKWMASSGVAINPNIGFYFVAVTTLVTGTMFLMWLGEQM